MSIEFNLIRCYGCAYLNDYPDNDKPKDIELYYCQNHNKYIKDIEDCFEFTCPKNCQCNTISRHEPLFCEIIPEELNKLISI